MTEKTKAELKKILVDQDYFSLFVSENRPDWEELKLIALIGFVAAKAGEKDVSGIACKIVNEALEHPERYLKQ